MEAFVVQQLVVSIVKFLRQQVESSGAPGSVLNDEGAESVEVALQCLEAAYNLSPADVSSASSLYDIYSNAVELQATGTSYMETESLCPEDKDEAEILKNEGNELMREKKFLEAINLYTCAIDKDSSNAAYYCNRAAAHSKMNNHQKAIADCKKALQMDPNRSKAYSRMGYAYAELENAAEAKQCYKKAVELDPENESYKINLKLAEEKMQSQSQRSSNAANPGGTLFSALGGPGGLGPFASMAGMEGGAAGGPNIANMFNSPNIMSMATQLMGDPNMQNMLSSLIGGQNPRSPTQNQPQTSNESPPESEQNPATSTNPPNVDFLLNAGMQLAEQMQAQNPQLVEQLRSQLSRSNLRRGENQDKNPPS